MTSRLVLLACVGCGSSSGTAAPYRPPVEIPARVSEYPPARRGDVVEDHHGLRIADPYRWLEAMESTETRSWLAAENAYTDKQLAKIEGRDRLHARLGELVRYPKTWPPTTLGGRYFWIASDGVANQPVLLTAPSLEGKPAVLLDPNVVSPDNSLAFAGLSISSDGKRISYGLAIGGGDWQEWRVRDVATGADLADKLTDIKYYSPAFTRDKQGLYYSRFPTPEAGKALTETDHDCKVYFHRIGTPVAQDTVIYERPDQPTLQFEPSVTRDGRYLVITIGDGQVGDRGEEQIAYVDLDKPGSKPALLVEKFGFEYVFLGNEGPVFYFKTTAGAPNKRIVATDIRSPVRAWREIIPATQHAIDDAKLVGRQVFVMTLEDAHVAVAAYDLAGKKLRDVALPGLGTVYGFRSGPDARETFYQFTSFTVPGAVYRYDLATGTSTPWQAPKVAFDPATLETTQVFYKSKDGTRVPMFVTGKRGLALDGSHPTILTGYGGFGLPLTPYFDPFTIAWVERGGVFVVANIRGGGEYGEAWHQAAIKTNRQVAYDDFIAAGEALVARKYTTAQRLGIVGTSGGGQLVGAVMLQRPDLFGAAVPIAGVLDMVRFHLFGQGAGWQGDLGSPDDPRELRALFAYSPVHNAKPGKYPPTLVITSDHDVRVPPLHSYKFAAALQAAQTGPAPILLRVQTVSGHGGGFTLTQEIDQQTEVLAFFAHHLGLAL
ncbi:MAG: prolyl oligopeptidase family serine peptidase [Kofleriaceae bacterium]